MPSTTMSSAGGAGGGETGCKTATVTCRAMRIGSRARSRIDTTPNLRARPLRHWYDDQLVRLVVDGQRAVLGHHDDVFDAGAPAVGEVDARLDGKRHAGGQRQAIARDDVGLFVNREPDAVPGAVHEELREP